MTNLKGRAHAFRATKVWCPRVRCISSWHILRFIILWIHCCSIEPGVKRSFAIPNPFCCSRPLTSILMIKGPIEIFRSPKCSISDYLVVTLQIPTWLMPSITWAWWCMHGAVDLFYVHSLFAPVSSVVVCPRAASSLILAGSLMTASSRLLIPDLPIGGPFLLFHHSTGSHHAWNCIGASSTEAARRLGPGILPSKTTVNIWLWVISLMAASLSPWEANTTSGEASIGWWYIGHSVT